MSVHPIGRQLVMLFPNLMKVQTQNPFFPPSLPSIQASFVSFFFLKASQPGHRDDLQTSPLMMMNMMMKMMMLMNPHPILSVARIPHILSDGHEPVQGDLAHHRT